MGSEMCIRDSGFLAPQGAPRAHSSESYKKIMKIMEPMLKLQCSHVVGATLCILHEVHEFYKEMVPVS